MRESRCRRGGSAPAARRWPISPTVIAIGNATYTTSQAHATTMAVAGWPCPKWNRSRCTAVTPNVITEKISTGKPASRALAQTGVRAAKISDGPLDRYAAPSTAAVRGTWIVQAKNRSVALLPRYRMAPRVNTSPLATISTRRMPAVACRRVVPATAMLLSAAVWIAERAGRPADNPAPQGRAGGGHRRRCGLLLRMVLGARCEDKMRWRCCLRREPGELYQAIGACHSMSPPGCIVTVTPAGGLTVTLTRSDRPAAAATVASHMADGAAPPATPDALARARLVQGRWEGQRWSCGDFAPRGAGVWNHLFGRSALP